MSTRTDWGWFDKNDKPIAVGDEHRHWNCPNKIICNAGYFHSITDEWIDEGFAAEPCPIKYTDTKLEICEKCGNKFIYP